jgi:thioredoxin-like negative regulator of GroEL
MGTAGRRLTIGALLVSSWLTNVLAAGEIAFSGSLEAARELATAELPVVLTFSAPWCGWCRKMSATTFTDERVVARAPEFLWVKVDSEEEPVLAARFRVHGLPHTLILDSQERVLVSRPGYIPPETFLELLDQAIARPEPIEILPEDLLMQLADSTSAEWPVQVRLAVETMSRYQAADRRLVEAALESAGADCHPILVELLADERLAVRAAASVTLQRLTQQPLPFDPFAPVELRDAQRLAWQEWLGGAAVEADAVLEL